MYIGACAELVCTLGDVRHGACVEAPLRHRPSADTLGQSVFRSRLSLVLYYIYVYICHWIVFNYCYCLVTRLYYFIILRVPYNLTIVNADTHGSVVPYQTWKLIFPRTKLFYYLINLKNTILLCLRISTILPIVDADPHGSVVQFIIQLSS